ncbi:MAG: hypothetical protein INR65_18980, partial [Gluconacetobacter diazotrophicus]|nr:hypothetical protein [Gluconacetobacter diazotrophicus]
MGVDRRGVVAALACCGLVAVPARAEEAGQVRAGLDAFRVGAVAEAARDWGQAAENGDARAALLLGA